MCVLVAVQRVTDYFNKSVTCNFSRAQCKLPADGSNGPKHVGANIRYFNVNFNFFMFNKRCNF